MSWQTLTLQVALTVVTLAVLVMVTLAVLVMVTLAVLVMVILAVQAMVILAVHLTHNRMSQMAPKTSDFTMCVCVCVCHYSNHCWSFSIIFPHCTSHPPNNHC